MKKILISASIPQYKANLHCHSTFSDGKFTPEELKAHYMAHGYAVIAFTDHERLYGHNELTDGDFLALNGYEIGFCQAGGYSNTAKVCHLCLICPDKTYLTPVDVPDCEDPYSAERINETIRRAEDAGYFVTYNHPVWSLEAYPEYSRYHGMDALEIYNYSSGLATESAARRRTTTTIICRKIIRSLIPTAASRTSSLRRCPTTTCSARSKPGITMPRWGHGFWRSPQRTARFP